MIRLRSLFLAVVLSSSLVGNLTPRLAGQIETWHGDPRDPTSFSCELSGLKGMGSDCGTKYDEMVFTARILSISPAPNDDLRLTLSPETIFKGTPTIGMEILAAQWRCLPEMKVGDSWLFSLYRDSKSKELIVNYGSRSGPEGDENQQIELLRRLARLDAAGVVKGRAYTKEVTPDGDEEQSPSVSHAITLTRGEDGKKFRTLTDRNGRFQFEPLAAGKYEFDPNTKLGIWTEWSGEIDVQPHGCTDFDLDFHVDGQIAGRLIFPAEVDPSSWQVEAKPADDPDVVPSSAWTDSAGRFVLHGLRPGKYVVVFEKTDMRDGPNLQIDLFAPGDPESGQCSGDRAWQSNQG